MANCTVAAQLFTLRDKLKTPEQIREVLPKVKEMGYSAVQVSGMGPIDPNELKGITQQAGLTICATHISYNRLQNDLDAVIDEHKLWDCKYVGLGSMPREYRTGKDGFLTFVKEANEIARKISDAGLKFIYHNHAFEFMKFDGVTGMELLFNESDPEVFDFEIDTYWVQAGGADPVEWIKKMKGRMDVVHFKDMVRTHDDEQTMAEVGEGNLNWPSIIEACKDIEVKWAAVEQDKCDRDPLESLAISYKNLVKLGLK